MVKVNFDALVFQQVAGLSLVAHDHFGEELAAAFAYRVNVMSPYLGKRLVFVGLYL